MAEIAMRDTGGEYRGDRLLIFTAVYIPIQVFCVALRYLARHIVKGAWGLDDVVVLISLVIQLCKAGMSIGSITDAGVGYHVAYLEETHPEKLKIWFKYIVANSVLYWATSNLPKLAILLLYRRLFPNKSNRVAIHSLIGILVVQSIVITAVALVGWFPLNANGDPVVRHGIDNKTLSIWGSLPNIITDVAMLILPMRVVWNLHLATRLKVGLVITFLVGSLGLITSIVRFITFFQNDAFADGTWAAVNLTIWTQMETGMYLISACLMTYRPLLERIGRRKILSKLSRTPHPENLYKFSGSEEASASIMLKPRLNADTHGFQRLGNDETAGSRVLATTDIHEGRVLKAGRES